MPFDPARRTMTNLTPFIRRPEEWTQHAACKPHPKDWWYPKEGQFDSPNTRKARAICNTCAVKQQCGDYAEKTNEEYGIWGGMSASERSRTRRKTLTGNSAPRRRHTPRTPAAQAIIVALADGRWATYDQLVTAAGHHIDQQRALTRYNKFARPRGLDQHETPTAETTRIGVRMTIIDICHNLYQAGVVVRNYGRIRLTDNALTDHHRNQNNGPQ